MPQIQVLRVQLFVCVQVCILDDQKKVFNIQAGNVDNSTDEAPADLPVTSGERADNSISDDGEFDIQKYDPAVETVLQFFAGGKLQGFRITRWIIMANALFQPN